MATVASTCELDFAIATRSEWPREYAKVLLLWRVEGRYIPIIRAGLVLTGGQPLIFLNEAVSVDCGYRDQFLSLSGQIGLADGRHCQHLVHGMHFLELNPRLGGILGLNASPAKFAHGHAAPLHAPPKHAKSPSAPRRRA